MSYLRELWHDAAMALYAARDAWLRARWLRKYPKGIDRG